MKITNRKSIPTKEETAALNALQPKWVKWSECWQRYHVDRIGQDMGLTRKRFIEDPSEANEAELLRCADVSLLGKQYCTVRETCDEALRSLAYTVRDIVVPMLERAVERLQEDLVKAEAAEVKERRRVQAAGGFFARSPKSDCTNLELAISQLELEIHNAKELNTVREPADWLQMVMKC